MKLAVSAVNLRGDEPCRLFVTSYAAVVFPDTGKYADRDPRAGRLIAPWLRSQEHDVVESRERGPDPGDRTLLELVASESRILITIDTDFGQ